MSTSLLLLPVVDELVGSWSVWGFVVLAVVTTVGGVVAWSGSGWCTLTILVHDWLTSAAFVLAPLWALVQESDLPLTTSEPTGAVVVRPR